MPSVLAFLLLFLGCGIYPCPDTGIYVSAGQFFKDVGFFRLGTFQETGELTLREHCRTAELIEIQACHLFYPLPHILLQGQHVVFPRKAPFHLLQPSR